MTLASKQLPSIANRSSSDAKRPVSRPVPHYQIISRHLATGAVVNSTVQEFYSYRTNLAQSFVPEHPGPS
jgi:hypothetical protein